ncbi:hypothetical protein D3C72_652120 [compost metagenome]
MAVALAVVQQAVELVGTAGDGGGLQPAVIGGAVTGFQARTDVFARLDDVVGIKGVVADGAADGVAAVQHRGRATENFHAFDDFRIDVVALGLGVRAVEETVRHFDAVNLSQDAVAVDAANVIAADAATLTGAADGHTRLVADQILDGVDIVAVQILTGLHGDGGRHAVDRLLLTGGADGHLIQIERAAGVALFQHDVVVADFAEAQVGPHQQALQGFFGWQRATHARRRHALTQFCRQADLPTGHGGEGIERRHQRLLADGERVIAHVARRLLGGRHQRRSARHQDGRCQQRQYAGRGRSLAGKA